MSHVDASRAPVLRRSTRRFGASWPAWIGLAWVLAAVAWGAWIRVDTTLADPNFDAHDARGLLRSDPALLYYLTDRIQASSAAGRLVPAEFHADPRIQHPYLTDVPAEFPVGQEFLVAWSARLVVALGYEPPPLHVVALVVMALVSASFVVGIFVLVLALTASHGWASLAVFLALVTPANYRTIGFLLVGEDLAVPLFALHLGLLARAAGTGRRRDYLASGLAVAVALCTWHASSFLVTLELAVLVLGALWTGRSALESRAASWVLVPPVLAGLVVPVLRSSGLLCSPAAALALALLVPFLVRRRGPLSAGRARVLVAGALLVALVGLGALAPSSYAHVHQVVWAKLRHFGRFPVDPSALSFDARLLWQGPFETLALGDLLRWCGWPLALLLAAGTWMARGTRRPGFELFLTGFLGLALPTAWMFARLTALVGLLGPPCVALVLARVPRRFLAHGMCALLALLQAGRFAGFVGEHRIVWYLPAPARAELTALIEFVRSRVPADEPITGDFVNSTALLAHTRHPIVLQPKYETDRSRRQAEAFLTTFFQGSSEDLAALLRGRFRSRYLLVDRYVLWELSRVTAGLRASETAPRPGTAAELFLAPSTEALGSIPGFELLYRGASGINGADYRLFRLRE